MGKKNKKQTKKKNQQRQNVNNKKKASIASSAENDRPLIDEIDTKLKAVSLKPFITETAIVNDRPGGLQNLGNTCYFNSVMQVMGQTYVLHRLLKERCQTDFQWNAKTFYWKEKTQSFASESLHLRLPGPTSLLLNFLQLQQQIFQGGPTTPRALFNEIQREKQQFEGYAQQDAQELLLILLDGLRKAEINRQQKALIEGLKIQDAKNPTDEEREKAKRYKITAKHTVIDAIFGGQLLSIIHCTVCDYRSFTFEPFTDLALSISEKNDDFGSANNLDIVENSSNTPNKKKDKKGKNKVKKETDEDDESEQSPSPQIDTKGDDEENSNFSPKNRKKKREEKKAARRAEKKRLQQQKQETEKTTDEILCNGDDEQSSCGDDDNDETETCPVAISQQSSDDEEKEELIKQQIFSTDDSSDSSNNDDSSSSNSKNSSENSPGSNEESKPKEMKISEEFRYKFYLFAHQRMSRTDDDYQNMDLGKLLRNFIKEETLDGSNKYLCERCSKAAGAGQKVYSKAIRCQLIAMPPPVLILQLKRFEASGGRRMASMYKLNSKVSFPEKLYLSPYTSRIYEYFSRFYEPECNPDDISDGNDQRLEYTLYGVVIHSGSLRFGHYMAYVAVRPNDFECNTLQRFLHLKPFVSNIDHILQVVQEDLTKTETTPVSNNHHPEDPSIANDGDGDDSKNIDSEKRKWYFISDSSVSAITMDSVLKDATSPYLLFYERTK